MHGPLDGQQVRGRTPNAAMDIYSLGIVCYECLAGHTPFRTGDIHYQIINETPPDIEGLPGHINHTIQKALAKKPEIRPQSARQLIILLKTRPILIVKDR